MVDTLLAVFAGPIADLATVLIGALVAFAFGLYRKHVGIADEAAIRQIEVAHRDALEKAARNFVLSYAKEGKDEGIDTLQAHLRGYLERQVPEAIAELAPPDEVLRRLIQAFR